MRFRPLGVEGAWEITPRQIPDERGLFAEGFRADLLAEHTGHPMVVRQTNISISVVGAIRGIHYASLPTSQAKYVTAVAGAFLDYVVDIRVGSPTFGHYDVVRLDTLNRRAVYVSEGLGHMLVCLDAGTAVYLCSSTHEPSREKGLTPFDEQVAIPWPPGLDPIVSDRDRRAPTLAQAGAAGLLPDYAECLAFRQSLHA
jgi:dTDP-4-dehydrorhamnose 3,5-epimerase